MLPMASWLLAIPVLGFVTGMRSMTPIAIVCFFAYRGHLAVANTWAAWSAHLISVVIFTVFALGEFIGDKLPKTPNRTAIFPLVARVVFGGLVGALAATGVNGSAPEGIILGAISALVGTFLSFNIRRHLVQKSGFKDL